MNKRSNLKKQGYWKFIKLIKSYCGFKKEINIFLRPECNMTSFYNNISCNHKWSYSVNWWLLEKKPSINLYVDSATTISSAKPRHYPAKQFLVWQWHCFRNYRSYFQCRDQFFSCHQEDPYPSMVSMNMVVIWKCKFKNNLSSVIRDGLLAWQINKSANLSLLYSLINDPTIRRPALVITPIGYYNVLYLQSWKKKM